MLNAMFFDIFDVNALTETFRLQAQDIHPPTHIPKLQGTNSNDLAAINFTLTTPFVTPPLRNVAKIIEGSQRPYISTKPSPFQGMSEKP